GLDRGLRVRIRAHLDEREAARAAGLAIHDDRGALDLAPIGAEQPKQLVFHRVEGEVADKETFTHCDSAFGLQHEFAVGGRRTNKGSGEGLLLSKTYDPRGRPSTRRARMCVPPARGALTGGDASRGGRSAQPSRRPASPPPAPHPPPDSLAFARASDSAR